MNKLKRKWLALILLLVLGFGLGFLWSRRMQRVRIKIGEHVIEVNPQAVPNPERVYTLHLWDYNWPVGAVKSGYRRYLEKAVAVFQKSYPNIKVEITLLDIVTGPARLSEALQHNAGPDVYASAFQIPPYDFRCQIPVGLFLTPEETAEYPSSLRRMVIHDKCLWALPRWVAPGLWIGNRELLEKTGLSLNRIRAEGWTWEQLAAVERQLPSGRVLLAANPAANGFFRQLAANSESPAGHIIPLWNGQSVGAVLDLLTQIAAVRQATTVIGRDFTPRFLSGRAAILAGVRPGFFPLLRQKQPGVVLLPVPSRFQGQNAVVAENGVLCVYRNHNSHGDDHIAAAVKLASFLSTYRDVDPWVEMMLVPAAKNAAAVWSRQAAPLITPTEAAYLIRVSQKGNLQNLNELPEYQNTIYPVLLDFLGGKMAPSQAQALMFDH